MRRLGLFHAFRPQARYAMLRRVKETFQAEGVDMPYPTQVTINKTGDPPPQPAPP